MLIGNILEKTRAEAAWQLCADKLADWTRTSWQQHIRDGEKQWEDSTHEDPNAIPGLREEGFKDLVGLDYIFKWWGARDSEELAGVLDVIWKTVGSGEGESVTCYRTWIKLADRDFILGLYREEGDKREYNRAEFRKAFAQWRELFIKL